MQTGGTLLRCDEAQRHIERVKDPVTRNLLNMAFTQVVKHRFLVGQDAPTSDFDMFYFVEVLEPFFAEHEILARTLAGEKVGAWFDEEA